MNQARLIKFINQNSSHPWGETYTSSTARTAVRSEIVTLVLILGALVVANREPLPRRDGRVARDHGAQRASKIEIKIGMFTALP